MREVDRNTMMMESNIRSSQGLAEFQAQNHSTDLCAKGTYRSEIEELNRQLAELDVEESEIQAKLSDLSHASSLDEWIKYKAGPVDTNVKELQKVMRSIRESLAALHGSSEELSCNVRRLLKVQSRLGAVAEIVNEILQLREDSSTLKEALSRQDFEEGVRCAARISALKDKKDILGEAVVFAAAEQSRHRLISIIRQNFEKAVAENNQESVARYAKLLHPLGLLFEGIIRYLSFIRQNLSNQCAANFRSFADPQSAELLLKDQAAGSGGQLYVALLTKCFVSIADIVQDHQTNIEQEFGSDNFIIFLRGLQEEADIQGTRILDKFHHDHMELLQLEGDEADGTSISEMDILLDELCLLSQRTHQYHLYLSKCSQAVVANIRNPSSLFRSTDTDADEYDETHCLLKLSVLMKRMQELMSSYVILERLYMKTGLLKAVGETDEILMSDDNEPSTSTLVDDAFFIAQKSIVRAITSGDVNAACAVTNHASTLLSTELRDSVVANLDGALQAYQNCVSDIAAVEAFDIQDFIEAAAQRRQRSSHTPVTDKPRGASLSWIHSLNNVLGCVDNFDRLMRGCEIEFDERFEDAVDDSKPPATASAEGERPVASLNRTLFKHCIQNLETTRNEFQVLHDSRCALTAQMFLVHLTLAPPHARHSATAAQPPPPSPMAAGQQVLSAQLTDILLPKLKTIVHHVKSNFLPTTAEVISSSLVDLVVAEIENYVFSQRVMTLQAAVQLDTDIRTVMTFLTAHVEHSIRHKFAKLIQIGEILSVTSEEEFQELVSPHLGKKWKLGEEEITKVRNLRVDMH